MYCVSLFHLLAVFLLHYTTDVLWTYIATNNTCARILFRDWTRQQKEEKDRIAMEQRKADSLYSNKSIEMDQRAVELSFADAQTRRVLNVAIKEYNKAMASTKNNTSV